MGNELSSDPSYDSIEETEAPSASLLDSITSQRDDLLQEKLENAFQQSTAQVRLHEIAKIACEHDPIDLAFVMYKLPYPARAILFDNLPSQMAQVRFLIDTDRQTRTVILRHLNDGKIEVLVALMPPDEAVSVLDNLSTKRYRKVLDNLESKKAQKIKELHSHDRYSVGRLMTNDFFAFSMQTTLEEVSEYIRNHPGINFSRRVFVLNTSGELQGYVSVRSIIVNPKELPLKQLMQSIAHKVSPDATREEAVDLVERYKISVLPVVDKLNYIVGVLTYEDIIEAMEDIADETIARIGGTIGENISEHQPLFARFSHRAPWLLVTLVAGFFSEAQMAFFSKRVWDFAPFFIPLITGMSGTVGIQSSTVLVRGIGTGELSAGSKDEAILREMTLGLVTGALFGIICGVVVYTLSVLGLHHISYEPFAVAMMVSVGVFGACFTATLLGAFSPFICVRFGIDPAVASGPIVTAFNDVLSAFIYFVIVYTLGAYLF